MIQKLEQTKMPWLSLDPRVKLLQVLFVSLLAFLVPSVVVVAVLVCILFALMTLEGLVRLAALIAVFWVALIVVGEILILLPQHPVPAILALLIYVVSRFLVIGMAGAWIVKTVEVNDFITSLRQMGLPQVVIIPLAVMVRFIPTILLEMRYIREAMKLRNLEISLKGCLLRPVQMVECLFVPLLMRCLKMADELSMSAMTRGIESPRKRTSYHVIRFSKVDGVFAVIFVCLFGLLLYADRLWL
jgi:energy-coupling factor transporter transmembrane protein EcfT